MRETTSHMKNNFIQDYRTNRMLGINKTGEDSLLHSRRTVRKKYSVANRFADECFSPTHTVYSFPNSRKFA
jgi:hypothetical protein